MTTASKKLGAWTQGLRRKVPQPKCGPTVTKQEFQKQCDVNEIIKKFRDTGVIEHVKEIQGTFGDFTNAMDYQTSLNKVIEAQESFDALPANIKKQFKNDPAKLVDFVNNPKNLEEAAKLGLLNNEGTQKATEAQKARVLAAQDAKDRKIQELEQQLAKNKT